MYWYMIESRSDNDYGESDSDAAGPSWQWSDVFWFPVVLLLALFVLPVVPLFALICDLLIEIYASMRTKITRAKRSPLGLLLIGLWLAGMLALAILLRHPYPPRSAHVPDPTSTATLSGVTAPSSPDAPSRPRPPTSTIVPSRTPTPTRAPRSIIIPVDDFSPQPIQGQSIYFFNRLEGDHGAINNSIMTWGQGQVTTTISVGNTWGGGWMSLNHPIREGPPINFSAILPAQILPAYQSQITGLTVQIARSTPNRTFRLELKDGGALRWTDEIVLNGGSQTISVDLPALGAINELVWVLDHAVAGDFVVFDSIAFTATTQITDTATAAFVWSYGMLLNNWNPTTGLARDRAKDASGEFDAIQATGSLAAATTLAEQLGVVSRANAIQVVNSISQALLVGMPRFHGLWPHFVRISPGTGAIAIVSGTEWSSVDTVIAAVGLLTAQSGLGLDTSGAEQMLRTIDWDGLLLPTGISQGYDYEGNKIPWAWDVFGGESWLVELAYASATGQVAPIPNPSPPTANGSGFIDELAWLFVPPPFGPDTWGTDWTAFRPAAADKQINYYPSNYPTSCFARFGLFGLSAAEVADPSLVSPGNIYQAFGVGGRDPLANDGSALLGAPVVVPHDAALIASLRPKEAIRMWDWLIENGLFSPLTNVESLMFSVDANCDPALVKWNQLKGSWNLSLQTLGWGRYLAERRGQAPVLWQATTMNSLLRQGYLLLAPGGSTSTLKPDPTSTPAALAQAPLTPFAVYTPPASETPVAPEVDTRQAACEGKPLYSSTPSPGHLGH